MKSIKPHRKGTGRPAFFLIAPNTSHNICNIKLGKPARKLRQLALLGKSDESVIPGQLDMSVGRM